VPLSRVRKPQLIGADPSHPAVGPRIADPDPLTPTCAQPTNVLMVSNYPSDTRYAWWLMEHFWATLARFATSTGGQAYVVYPKITSLPEIIAKAPIVPVELSIPWTTRAEAARAKQFLREHRISLMYLTDRPYLAPHYVQARLAGVRHIVVHDHSPGDRPPLRGMKGALKAVRNRLPWITADRVFTVSELMRQRCVLNGRVPTAKAIAIQNGIVPVPCSAAKREAVRAQLAIDEQTIVVVTTGRAHPYKRFDFVVRCADELRRRAPALDVRFLLVGDGPSLDALRHEVTRLDLERSVGLLGFRPDVRDILCGADLAMHAALGEAFSLSIVEYMSAGLPVLVPDIPCVRQAIRHGKNGMVFPDGDVQDAVTMLIALAIDGGMRHALGATAKRDADCEYNLDRCTTEFVRAIRDLVD
jgi:glycosyltransferase involved in cell wall biosynthesis